MGAEDRIYTTIGLPAVYTPKGGAPQAITVLVTEDVEAIEQDGFIFHKCLIDIRQSEVAARPGYQDSLTTQDGAGNPEKWEIVDVGEARANDHFGGEWLLTCIRNPRPVI